LCIPPSLCTVSSSVDDEDIAIRQEQQLTHVASQGHVL
jgi:hypothetical protein